MSAELQQSWFLLHTASRSFRSLVLLRTTKCQLMTLKSRLWRLKTM